jgi:hypothetical protein
MNEHHDFPRMVYIAAAAMAGAVTALSMLKWKSMSWAEIAMTLFVGTTFSIFVVPWIGADWAGIDITNLRAICGITYVGAMGSNVFIPMLIRRFKREGEAE